MTLATGVVLMLSPVAHHEESDLGDALTKVGDIACLLRADFRRSVVHHSTAAMDRARETALQVQQMDEVWERESGEFERDQGRAPLRLLTPYEEVEGDYARMIWKVASVLARELLA